MTTMEIHNNEWKKANGRFYALANKCGMSSDDVHATVFQAFGKTHTSELTPGQLNSLSDSLSASAIPEKERQMDTLRKRVLSAVRRYCKEMGYRTDTQYVIQIIQRGGKNFNAMTEAELQRKYNTFNKLANEIQTTRGQEQQIIPIGSLLTSFVGQVIPTN